MAVRTRSTMTHSAADEPFGRLLAVGAVLLIAVALAIITATLPGLPPIVATHFGLSGAPDGWMSHRSYAVMIVAFVIGFPLVTWLLVAIVPRRFPRLAKIPHRDLWFAPSNRERTLRRLDRFARIQACGGALLAIGVHVLVLAKNVPGDGMAMLATAIVILAAGVLVLLAGALATRRAFRHPP